MALRVSSQFPKLRMPVLRLFVALLSDSQMAIPADRYEKSDAFRWVLAKALPDGVLSHSKLIALFHEILWRISAITLSRFKPEIVPIPAQKAFHCDNGPAISS